MVTNKQTMDTMDSNNLTMDTMDTNNQTMDTMDTSRLHLYTVQFQFFPTTNLTEHRVLEATLSPEHINQRQLHSYVACHLGTQDTGLLSQDNTDLSSQNKDTDPGVLK